MAAARLLFRFLAGLLVILIAIGLVLPDHADVERTTTINSSPEKVFAQINSMRNFNSWSPWAEMDPNTEYSFSGPEFGEGAMMMWQSRMASVGQGTQTIRQSVTNQMVETALDFGEGNTGTARFELTPTSDGRTVIVWRFHTEFGWDLFGRYLGLMMDSMVGASYEKGLSTLKRKLETQH